MRWTAVLGEDFPTDTPSWQVVLQWHHTAPDGASPLALDVSRGQLLLLGGSDEVRAIGPVRPGETVDLALHVVFSRDPATASVTVLRDGRPTGVTDWHPPRGTLRTETAYLKTGLYRAEGITGDGRLTVTDLRIGRTPASLGTLTAPPVASAPAADGTTGETSSGSSAGDAPARRDLYARPFAWDSIWNLPLATTARYGDFDPQVGTIYADVENISLDPDAPVRRLGGEGSGEVHVAPDLTADGSWNNCSTLLVAGPDRQTIVQGQPMVLRAGGDPSWRVGWGAQSLTGDGREGCHGGSGLSGVGGTIREGELSSDEPLRHALKVSLPCTTSCSPEHGGFWWPAVKADSGYEGRYGGESPAVNMGALLALPPDTDLDAVTEPDVRRVAEALRTYGAYVVDETGGAPAGSFQVQSTALREFPHIDSPQMRRVFDQLRVVENNGPSTPGGGALDAPRRAACAPAFTDGSGAPPATCGRGAGGGAG